MFLLAGPSFEFSKFIQILCWIVLPVLAGSIALTVFLYYRKKKKDTNKDENTEDKIMQASAEQVGYTNGNGEYILFDHSHLIQHYKDKLSYNHARYTALQYDFAAMEGKYASLATFIKTYFITNKKNDMGNLPEQMPKQLQDEINKLTEEHAAEKKELLTKLEQLERSYQRMEEENRSLQDQISMSTVTDDEKAVIVNKWKEENSLLRDKVANQEYLEDLVEEKKAQVLFLQNQIEERIKNLYQSEHQRLKAIAEAKQLKENKEVLENELLLKREQADKMQVVLCEKEEFITGKEQTLTAKLDQVTTLENMLREAKDQNELLTASVLESQSLTNTLKQQLTDEQLKVQFLTQKLFDNKQMMRRLHKEFSDLMNDGSGESPVIPLRPDYGNKEKEETVTH